MINNKQFFLLNYNNKILYRREWRQFFEACVGHNFLKIDSSLQWMCSRFNR